MSPNPRDLFEHMARFHGAPTFKESAPDSFLAEIDDDLAAKIGIGEHEGYTGAFTRAEVLGAYRNGTHVTKVGMDHGDKRPLGAQGVVLGSMDKGLVIKGLDNLHRDAKHGLGYFVEWDDTPRMAVFIIAWKIRAL